MRYRGGDAPSTVLPSIGPTAHHGPYRAEDKPLSTKHGASLCMPHEIASVILHSATASRWPACSSGGKLRNKSNDHFNAPCIPSMTTV